MAVKDCIVTGGAGFIGCAVSELLAQRYRHVYALDILNPQIHAEKKRPEALCAKVELLCQDVCDPDAWDQLLARIDEPFDVLHLAAETGTGQSLNESTLHTYTNVVGTSRMLDAFTRHGKRPEHIMLTSSRAVYGEGKWVSDAGEEFYPGQRTDEQLKKGQWDFENAHHVPFASNTTVPMPTSVYGATKLCQENLLKAWCDSFGVAWKVVRLQNVYGPGQSLINSYTGIVPLFVRMAKACESIPLYEDGKILRDFVYIGDVAAGIVKAMDSPAAARKVLDIGTGETTTIGDIAEFIARRYHAPAPRVCGLYRNGDVRHASCDMTYTQSVIDFKAAYTVEAGLELLCRWIDERM